jgi:hypothetical protein
MRSCGTHELASSDAGASSECAPLRRSRAGLAARALLVSVVVVWLGAARASADASWLSLAGDGCGFEREELAGRILDAVVGTANAELSVDVDIIAGARATAIVRLMRGAERLGVRKIEAASCEEALAAVVAVTALALSSTVMAVPATGAAEVTASEQPPIVVEPRERSPAIEPASAMESESEGPRLEPSAASSSRWRMLAGVGIDVGTIDEGTATIAIEVGAALQLGGGEARALARYGVPTTQQEREEIARFASDDSGSNSTSTRTDFSAAALDYCLGIDTARWLGACGGLELALTRRVQVEHPAGRPRSEREHVALGVGPTAGLALVLRAVALQPQLGLSAQWPLVGARSAAHPIGLRAIFAGSAPF